MRNPFDSLDELRRQIEDPLKEMRRQFDWANEVRRQIEGPLGDFQRVMEQQHRLVDMARGGVLVDLMRHEMTGMKQVAETVNRLHSETSELQSRTPQLFAIPSVIEELYPQINLDDWTRAGALASDLVRQHSRIAQSVSGNVSSILQQQRDWWEQLQSTQFRPFEAIARQISEDIARFAAGAGLEYSFAGDFLAQLELVQEAEDEEALSSALDRVLAWFLRQVRVQPASASIYLALLGLFLTIAIVLYTQISAQRSEGRLLSQIDESSAEVEERILQKVADSEQRMLEEFRDRIPPPKEVEMVVVTRRLHLRTGPSSKSRSLRILYPNTALVKRSEEGLWLEVEFFDFEIGERREGWVCRRFVDELAQPNGESHPDD